MTPPIKPLSAPKMAVRTAVILFIFVVIFTGLLSGAYLWTKSTIDVAAAEEKMKLVDEVLPRNAYDNDLLKDAISLPPSPALGTEDVSTAYRAKRAGQTTAVVLEAVAPDGYAGRIHLLLAIGTDGTVLGVRATQHKETPGLGDYIEPKKDKNKNRPWITQFDGLKPAEIEDRDWKVRKDGGRFDSVAGATVTPRAVIKAVRKAALHVTENRETFFAAR